MLKKKIKVYFLGSGKIGIPALNSIIDSCDIELVGIGTQEDRAGGRKKKLISTPVAVWAEDNKLKVDKIKSVNTEEFLSYLDSLNIDFLLVASFGQILKEKLLNIPRIDCINIHASILPKYRGASPIAAAIINGDEQTGIAIMKMEKGLDSGPVYSTYIYDMTYKEDAVELEDILGCLAGENIVQNLIKIKNEELKAIEQNHDAATHVWKIKKQDGTVDWNSDASYIERMVRAYYPWPGAFFFLKTGKKQKKIQITSAEIVEEVNNISGQILSANKKEWVVACGNNSLRILKLIPEGKNEMTGPEFLRGCNLTEGINING